MFGRKRDEEVDEYGDERGEDNELGPTVRENLLAYTMSGPLPSPTPKEEGALS